MTALNQVPVRIPDEWDAQWYRVHLVETLAKADIRNAIGVGVTITSDGNSVATLTVDGSADLVPHNDDPFAHVAAFIAHQAESDPHSQYPLKAATAVADASGGATVDTEARAQLNALLAVLRASGVIGT